MDNAQQWICFREITMEQAARESKGNVRRR
jgi:hypothetical protein